jgi:general secretion pathway protein A
VHHASRGIPRLINAICDRALLGAFTQDHRRVTAPTVRRAAGEVLGAVPRRGRPWRWVGAAAVAGALLAGAAILIGQTRIGASAGGPFTAWIKPEPALPGLAPPSAPAFPAPRIAPASPTTSTTSTPSESTVAATLERKPAAPASVTLGEILADPGVRADKKSAFASLYARWRLDFDKSKTALGCERGRAEGLECLFKTGTWAKLRRYNVPAIIELSAPSGARRYATVVALGEDTATLDFGDRRYVLPFSEVDRYWEGPFIVLWRAASVTASSIAPGARGKDVEWVRQRLSEMDGAPVGGRQRDVFDEDLRSRVMAFQRARSLVADGIVGEETLLHLSAGARDQRIPRLSDTGS